MFKTVNFFFIIATTAVCFAQQQDFTLSMNMHEGKPVVQIFSTETFPCIGYGIKVKEFWREDTLVLAILGFVQPVPCYDGMDIAKEAIPIRFSSKDTIAIAFRWKDHEDVWRVTKAGDSFSAVPVHTRFTVWKQ